MDIGLAMQSVPPWVIQAVSKIQMVEMPKVLATLALISLVK
jgi:hypothetical protein